jgi:hypothetical protein
LTIFFQSPLPFFSAFLLFDNHGIPSLPLPVLPEAEVTKNLIFIWNISDLPENLDTIVSKHIRISKIGVLCVSFQRHALVSIYRKGTNLMIQPDHRGTFLQGFGSGSGSA